MVGDTAYVAAYKDGLLVLDVSVPGGITLLGAYDTATYAYDVQVVDTIAYVADQSGGLLSLDVSDPGGISLLDTTNFLAFNVQVVGTVAYVTGAGLQIIDLNKVGVPPALPGRHPQFDGSGRLARWQRKLCDISCDARLVDTPERWLLSFWSWHSHDGVGSETRSG